MTEPVKADLSASEPGSPGSPQERSGGASERKKRGTKLTAQVSIDQVEASIGYVFNDRDLLVTAFTHVSSLGSTRNRIESYQRLEFLGDHVLGLIVSDMLYRAFPKADEGELSKRLADLVRKESCADVARSLGLTEAIKLGPVGAGAALRLRKSVLGDICEAVIGAIFLDGGYGAADTFVQTNWADRMLKPARPLRDPKTVLQEWAQGRGLPTPLYREISRTGPDHDPQFKVAVELPGIPPAEGVGGSKRIAEKHAASAMLAQAGVDSENNDG